MKEICSRARYDWVIALATSFPILEGGNVTLGGSSTRGRRGVWYHELGVIGVSTAHQTKKNTLLQQLLVFTRSFHEPYPVQVVARGEVEGWASRVRLQIDIFGNVLGLGLGIITGQKKKGLPSPRAEAGQGNIERVHEPEPIQITGPL